MADDERDTGGQHAVERAMAALAGLDTVPVVEHVARFDAVHRALTDALSAIDGA